MNTREKLSTYRIGTYSELIVAAAFTAVGCDVALPIGNQSNWDLVALEDGKWITVQVKTVSDAIKTAIPILQIRDPWKKNDFDLLVAVHPETGSLWKIKPREGVSSYSLREEFMWRGAIERTATPHNLEFKPFSVTRAENLAEQRIEYMKRLPTEKPAKMSESTWFAVQKWCSGYGYSVIAKDLGISNIGTRERVVRGLYNLGIGESVKSRKIKPLSIETPRTPIP